MFTSQVVYSNYFDNHVLGLDENVQTRWMKCYAHMQLCIQGCNLQNVMNMHNGYAYQISNCVGYKKLTIIQPSLP
jgi:hypothetical protein